jgi:glycosyltransferase involved in cell wall biosynthesis
VRQENRGLAAARNAGLARSRGHYLVFLDSDDRLLPDAVAAGAATLEARPECAFVYGHVRLVDRDGRPLPSPEQTCVRDGHYLELLRNNFIWTPGAVMYRRSAFDAVGAFDGSKRGCEDYDLSLRIARRFPVACHDRVVLEYRRHGENMSGRPGVMLQSSISALRAQSAHVRGNGLYETALASGIREMQRGYGEKLVAEVKTAVRARQWGPALRGSATLLRLYPRGLFRHAAMALGRAGRR